MAAIATIFKQHLRFATTLEASRTNEGTTQANLVLAGIYINKKKVKLNSDSALVNHNNFTDQKTCKIF